MELSVEVSFSAGHSLPEYDGPCRRVHGHNYKLIVTIAGKADAKSGMVLDFEELRRLVIKDALELVDHQNLNDVLPNPTAEAIVIFLWERLKQTLPSLHELRLYETPEYWVTYRGE